MKAIDLVKKLLKASPTDRLCMRKIKKHPFIKNMYKETYEKGKKR